MAKKTASKCPECGDKVPAEPIDRRSFLRAAGAGAAALALARVPAWGQDTSNKTAEELIKELYTSINDEQKTNVVHSFTDKKRLELYNAALGMPIGKAYSKSQQELVSRILKSISSGEEGWKQISRDGTWDASKSFEACGANLFGDVNGKYTWVFSGHHLTIRCDGNSDEGVAFGGPLYYGHTPNGYSDRNLFFYQTKSALAAFESLTEAQRAKAVCADKPIEGLPSVKLRPATEAKPGIAFAELSKESQALVEKTMADVLSPYRKADADEVLQVIKTGGGMEKVHLAFYKDDEGKAASRPWSFWRLEGPGFVWNYRVLPHVHTFVNISAKI